LTSPVISLVVRETFAAMLGQEFRPRSWLANRHVMTMAGHFINRDFRNAAQINQSRLFQVTPEAQLLTHCGWQPQKTAAPTLIVVHGLEGSSASKYALGTALKAYQAGFNTVRINQRGCGNTYHLSPMPYHAGLTADLRFIINELQQQDGLNEIYLVGFSLGGNQSLKLAGEYGGQAPTALKGVCAVSVPIDLSDCTDALHWWENRLYEWNFLLSLHRSYHRRRELHPQRYHFPPWLRTLTLRKFDDQIAGPVNGFRNAEDYYAQCSSAAFLKNIHLPTLIIQAKDDPFIPFRIFETTPRSEAVALLATTHGGHVGYIGNDTPTEDAFWMENRVVEYFRRLRETK
jgi:uncharacterized protein